MSTTAGRLAAELRGLANLLDASPDAKVESPKLYFCCKYGGSDAKQNFLALARMFPRPFAKTTGHTGSEYLITYKTSDIEIEASIERSVVCRVIVPEKIIPAVYECEPLLTAEEEEVLR